MSCGVVLLVKLLAFVIHPRLPFPFASSPVVEAPSPIIFGEWWNADVDAVESEMSRYGGGPNSSYAYTNNGLPGPLFPCSIKGILLLFIQRVERGKTYMLRIIINTTSSSLRWPTIH
ncbi:laccase [Salvia divinorum]|uniref:Laccase n=1 Tax=Salvia divinorum TaxID=28513 RepID=A0ABD1HB70_SALDI